MRGLVIVMLMMVVFLGACSKKTDTTQKTKTNVVQMNNTIAPPTPEAAKSPKRVLTQTVFTCNDKSKFTARFMPNEVEIDAGWRSTVILPQQIVASGFWYKNAQYELRGKGNQANWTVGKKAPVTCTASR